LGRALRIPFISLDHIHWEPGWRSTPNDAFKSKIEAALTEAGPSWVVEGDYYEKIGNTVLEKTTDLICKSSGNSNRMTTRNNCSGLDPPLLLYFPRLLLRTLMRLMGLQPSCSPGCEESASEAFFSKDSIILWCLTHHQSEREKNWRRMREIGLDGGSDVERRRMRRIGGWGREYAEWMEQVEGSNFVQKRD
jgi:hypothetical protein